MITFIRMIPFYGFKNIIKNDQTRLNKYDEYM